MQLIDDVKRSSSKKILEKLIARSKELEFEAIDVEGYELVLKITQPKAKFKAIISIHNTTLGPTLGGTRIYPYKSFDDAFVDVLRLSKGMTYKSAMAGVGLGGGKSVIIASPQEKTEEVLMAFGEAVNSLAGLYICAEDVGCTMQDIKVINRKTPFVTGLDDQNSSGDPGPFTAWGTFLGIQSAVEKVYGSKDLLGKKVAIQGLGNVGLQLANFLFWAGAELIVADLSQNLTSQMEKKYSAKVVDPSEILEVDCDVLAPCAMGGILNEKTIPNLKCKIVAGCANNQLLEDSHANLLKDKGILYAPDFVINAGGLINVACEIEKTGYVPSLSRNRVYGIYDRLKAIYEISEKNNISTHEAAISLADYRIKYEVNKRSVSPVFHHSN